MGSTEPILRLTSRGASFITTENHGGLDRFRAAQAEALTASAKTRENAVKLSLFIATFLTLFKLGVGWFTGSVGVISEGIHSLLDWTSAIIAFFAVREAGKPADEDHPFGHGKIEVFSSLVESVLLVLAAGVIMYQGVDRILHPTPVQHEWAAILVMSISIFLNFIVFKRNQIAAVETESQAIQVNAFHFLTDALTSVAVLAGLLVISLTGWHQIDAMMAFGIGIYIVLVSVRQMRSAFGELFDIQLPESERILIERLIESFKPSIVGMHELRTRKSGAIRHIDFHILVCKYMTVQQSHHICDEIESKLMDRFPLAMVTTHVEPCDNHSPTCEADCALAKKARGQKAQGEM